MVSRHLQLQALRHNGNCDQIMEWVTAQDMHLLTTIDIPTHRDRPCWIWYGAIQQRRYQPHAITTVLRTI